jgi:hypothetical protein
MLIEMNFMGFPFVADVDYSVTSYGSRASWDHPGDLPEFDIDSIVLSRDEPPPDHLCGLCAPRFEATGALFDCLANLDVISAAIVDAIISDAARGVDDDYC